MKNLNLHELMFGSFLLLMAVYGWYQQIFPLAILCGGILLSMLFFKMIFAAQSRAKIIAANQKKGKNLMPFLKKYAEADVAKMRQSILLASLGISLATVISAFHWVKEEQLVMVDSDPEFVAYQGIEVVPPVIDHFHKPETTPPPKISQAIVIDVVPDNKILNTIEIVDLFKDPVSIEPTQPTVDIEKLKNEVIAIPLIIEDTPPVEPEVIDIAEEMPEFPGGEVEMLRFVYKNYKYPALAKESNIEGLIVVWFVVNTDGSISNVELMKDIGAGCGDEAMRVVKTMPKWKPGKQGGKAVRVRYKLPIRLKLEK
ncbi:MAG: TonB family protein [Chitinophagales bacterium]|nr:TonB family protein [Chitinophagales bacterium]